MRSSRRTARRSRTGALVATSSLGGDLRDEPFPPMILLPLVNDAAQAGASDIRISAGSDAVPGSVWVAVEATPPLRWSDDRLEHLRGLARIYLGPSTVIDVEHRAGASAVLLRFARDADRRTRTRMLHGVPS